MHLSNWLSIYLAGIFIAYCTICLMACPSLQLATAIGAEIVALLISICIWNSGVFKLPEAWLAKLPKGITSITIPCMHYARSLRAAILSVVALLATLDFAAFACGAAGATGTCVRLYSAVPVSYWLGLHPGFTLEMLAGALVSRGDFQRAEPLFLSLVEVRQRLCGPTSDLAGAIYADMGDFCVRKGDLTAAEGWYRRSVALGVRTGRASGALATVLREQRRFDESRRFYLMALNTRRRVYGENSKQYCDTFRGYEKLEMMIVNRQVDR